MINLILLGLPGAGKGTVSERIVDKYKLAHISTGDMFREAMANETPVGLEAKSYIDKGNLVPDEVTAKLVEERLAKPDTNNGFILDGFPRTTAQAEMLEDITKRLNKPLTNVIALDVEESVLVDRLSARFMCKACGATYNKFSKKPKVEGTCDRCGGHEFYQREDDKPEVVRNRLQVNEKMNAPLRDFYQQKGLLSVVNGEQSPEKVFEDTDAILGKD
ncbi:adenylate kinase [Lactobacillus jensenii]|jgi:adenylate kinase|uniref:Adenylate kinase n=3 Tax=Lactobacillus TaxID=1578 RepID=A0A2I1XNF4_LACJE|nr:MULTISPECIES: adenylate kinase [Lactobacillus]EEQ69015.1 adenylate kinase [Lactobacillus jensenii 1153]EEU20659.1 adenylate kinase [Lactobacillus jensenii 27-2-CHN]EEX23806.1 adenylate kinase [Lactobacillus jensenii 115-3-CHN]EFH29943.1 adenylate kinase [Lactobacillus jensenii JV-V16]ERJ42171.1 adenylate kinase [Lactobacillus jensenii MD IIE-70(2)]MCT7680043.1 adenylate kinase [Lactobacillus crispatus]